MERLINRRVQGDLGEASAIEWLTSVGATVLLPIGHSPDFDLVAEASGRLLKIQVKTSTQSTVTPAGHPRSVVALVTAGGNRSWNGIVKRLDPARVDYLFAHTGHGRRWFIPTTALEARNAISLGGAKYSEFEIEPGRPDLSARLRRARASRITGALGGVSKWSKDGGCKPSGSAFAGSTPASPISSACRLPAVRIRPEARAQRPGSRERKAASDPSAAAMRRGRAARRRPRPCAQ